MMRKSLGTAKWIYTGLIVFCLVVVFAISAVSGSGVESIVVILGLVMLIPVLIWEIAKRIRERHLAS